MNMNNSLSLYTNTGRHITPQESAFIASYVLCKNASQAVIEAGYKTKAPNKILAAGKE